MGITLEEMRLLLAFRGLTDEQREDKVFEVEILAERNMSRRKDGCVAKVIDLDAWREFGARSQPQ